jgi:competence protein ComEC
VRWIRVGAAVAWAAAAAIVFWPSGSRELRVLFLDVGEGDAALMRMPGGAVVLVDAGPGTAAGSRGGEVVLEALKDWGVRRIDLFVWTHPEADHIGGAATVLGRVPVGLVLDPGFVHPSAVYEDALAEVKSQAVRWRRARRGQRLDFGDGVQITVLNPGPEPNDICNESSVVLRVAVGRRAVLLTGDAGELAEERMLRAGVEARADVLKVGHHGGRGSTTWAWLAHVAPRYAVISCGAANRFGHPDEEVLDRLRRRGAKVYRTDTNGSVLCTTDGQRLDVCLAPAR